jgi:hypothetical protein
MSELTFTGVGALAMESRADRANRYRKEASHYAELASSDPSDMMGDVHRRIADRYIRMARDLERREKDLTAALALLNKQEYPGSHRREYGAFFRALLRPGIWRRLGSIIRIVPSRHPNM